MMTREEREFELLKRQVFQREGLECKYYKSNYLKRRLAVRMRATGLTNYYDYCQLLKKDPEEYDRLLDRLTINVSQFLRDPSAFRTLETKVFPEIFKTRHIRVWSAGCANGEEPYTLAMLLKAFSPAGRTFEIMATDIDTNCLARAEQGEYKAAALANLPSRYRDKYFQEQNGRWAVKADLRKYVTFSKGDLTGALPTGPFHLIVCRNVLIYFTRVLQEQLLITFHERLAPGGFLMLGKTEVLLAETRSRYDIIDVGERVYRRREPTEPDKDPGE